MLTFATLVFPQPGGPYSITPEQVGLFNFVVSSGSCIWRWNKQVNWPWSCKDEVPWHNFQSKVKERVLLTVWRLRGISTAKVNRSHHRVCAVACHHKAGCSAVTMASTVSQQVPTGVKSSKTSLHRIHSQAGWSATSDFHCRTPTDKCNFRWRSSQTFSGLCNFAYIF